MDQPSGLFMADGSQIRESFVQQSPQPIGRSEPPCPVVGGNRPHHFRDESHLTEVNFNQPSAQMMKQEPGLQEMMAPVTEVVFCDPSKQGCGEAMHYQELTDEPVSAVRCSSKRDSKLFFERVIQNSKKRSAQRNRRRQR